MKSIGKLIGKAVAAPVKVAVSLPQIAADVVDEVAKAAAGK
jgi:hypothetical protein